MRISTCALCGKTLKHDSSRIKVDNSWLEVCVAHYAESDFWDRVEAIKKQAK